MESYADKEYREGGIMSNQEDVLGVVGLGYVGLPTALGLLDAGFCVIGVDIDERLVDDLNHGSGGRGHMPASLPNIGPNWQVSTNANVLKDADIILITF